MNKKLITAYLFVSITILLSTLVLFDKSQNKIQYNIEKFITHQEKDLAQLERSFALNEEKKTLDPKNHALSLKKQIEKNPKDVFSYIELAGISENPEEIYKKALEITPESPIVRQHLSDFYIKKGDILKGLEVYKHPYVLKYSLSGNLILSIYLSSMGRYDEAIKTADMFKYDNIFFEVCAVKKSKTEEYFCNAGYNLTARILAFGDPYDVKNSIKRSKAKIYYQKGDFDKALSFLGKKDNALKSLIFTSKGDFEKAENEILNMKNNSLFERGYLFLKKGKYQKAEEIFSKMNTKYNSKPLKYLALSYIYQEKFNEAIKELIIVSKKKDGSYNYFTNYNLAYCYLKIGDRKNAEIYLKKILSLNPDNKDFIEKILKKEVKTEDLEPFDRL